MILDTSALLAILLSETDANLYAVALARAGGVSMSAASYLEAAMVIEGRGDPVARAGFDRFEETLQVKVVDFTREHAVLARTAFLSFGKGRHKAALNFGDCIAYALAQERGEPLLFKGHDFAHTDIMPALRD